MPEHQHQPPTHFLRANMIIDSHQHFWKLDRGDYGWLTPDLTKLYQDFYPEDLKPLLDASGVSATIIVQATDTLDETQYLLKLANNYDWILGVVGWVDLSHPKASKHLNNFAQHAKFVGVRPMLQSIKDINWILKPELKPAINTLIDNDLCFDALILPKNLPALIKFSNQYPALKIVINHGAKPEISKNNFNEWAKQIQQISNHSNVYCKLSGLVTEADNSWINEDIMPYATHILGAFGADKIMYSSDWPVVNLASSYNEWLNLAKIICSNLTLSEQQAIFSTTALNFYIGRTR